MLNEYITIRSMFLSLILRMNFKRQVMRDQQLRDGEKIIFLLLEKLYKANKRKSLGSSEKKRVADKTLAAI